MKSGSLLLSGIIRTVFAVWTVVFLIYFPHRAPPAKALFYSIFPGLIISVATGGGHGFNPFVAAVGNFCFYFGTAYIVASAWKWCRTRAGKAQ
jgi:hypothetical protein